MISLDTLFRFVKQILIFLGVLIFLCGQEAARAEGDRFISFGIAGGGALSHNASFDSFPSRDEASFDPGYSGKLSLGVLFAETIHLEAEYLYTYHSIDSLISPPTVTRLTSSDRVTHNLMLSGLYRMEVPPLGDEHWTRRGFFLYFGGGVGFSAQEYSLETLATGSDTSFSGQVIVGFEKMNPSTYLFAASPSPFLQYRFLYISEGDFGAFEADASMHLIEFGFRFYGVFGK